ncbi:hypothetical protein GLYMA_18G290901v4 [Glycine max]|nr:hypothetical protein GLYMA_18G290901v4 [Glycine max]KAH1156661.1 hypothetical protein GYH30_051454 [Glycine max]
MMLLPTLSWLFYLRALTSALQSLVQSLKSVCKDGQEQCR